MLEEVQELLPEYIAGMFRALPKETRGEICEIRLRKNAPLSVSTYRKNLFLDAYGKFTKDIGKSCVCSERDLSHVINRLCEGSVYRYMNGLKSGYIVTRGGIRAGVVGDCVYDGDTISSVSSFTSVNLRIPHEIENCGDIISAFLTKNPCRSLLLISPPGYGKTTVIRSVAKSLGTGRFGEPRRVAVIDERGEILPSGPVGLIDRFSGYRKSDGIEIATRLFSPELIVCDEIGHSDDVEALLSVQNSGIPILATAHGESLQMVLKRPNIRKLIDKDVFSTFARIEKTDRFAKIIFEEREL